MDVAWQPQLRKWIFVHVAVVGLFIGLLLNYTHTIHISRAASKSFSRRRPSGGGLNYRDPEPF